MIDLPILSIDLEGAPVEYLLDQVLSPTDASIINAVTKFKEKKSKFPSAMEILEELSSTSSLKKTQLYDRLSRLSARGFITVKLLPRPRRYQVNLETIIGGVKNWVEEQRVSLEGITNELQSIQNFLNQMDTKILACAIAEKLSVRNT
ncbi:MAG: hypothetical protein JW779_03250 [Candidatus Thorarchaeota archaeon]|nr:hypothetical protein [Candidatus Thorarchaeota archaeon]